MIRYFLQKTSKKIIFQEQFIYNSILFAFLLSDFCRNLIFVLMLYVCINILIYLQNQMQTASNLPSQHHKLFKKFSVQTEIGYGSAACNSKAKSAQEQISQLKYAAHQSFLQVMQMQSLHQEQLESAKSQYNKLVETYKKRQTELLNKVTHLQNQMKSYHLHYIEMKEDTLDILPVNLTIQAISQCYSQQSQQISEIIKIMSGVSKKDFSEFQYSLFQQMRKYISSTKAEEIAKKFTDKLEQYVDQYCFKTMENLQKTNSWKIKYQELKKQYETLQSKYAYSQKELQNLKNHLKKLNTSKMQLQEKTFQLKKKLNNLESQFKCKKQMKENISSQCNPILSSKSNIDDANNSFDEQMKQIKNIVKIGSKLKRLNTFSCNTSISKDIQNHIKRSKGSEIQNNENDIN